MKLFDAMKYPLQRAYNWFNKGTLETILGTLRIIVIVAWIWLPVIIGYSVTPTASFWMGMFYLVTSAIWILYWGWVWMKVEEES